MGTLLSLLSRRVYLTDRRSHTSTRSLLQATKSATTLSAPSITGEALQFHWKNILKPVEKDLHYTRIHSTVTYYQEEEGYDYLKETSNSPETEAFATPVKWVGIKEKFFLMSIIANNKPFANGEVKHYRRSC